MFRYAPAALAALFALPALAEPPRVVVDIAPIHALAAQVMEGVAEPELLLTQDANPHAVQLRPSQARQNSGVFVAAPEPMSSSRMYSSSFTLMESPNYYLSQLFIQNGCRSAWNATCACLQTISEPTQSATMRPCASFDAG